MILGVAGKMRSGKDTLADILVEKFHFIKISPAWVLKHICRDFLSWDGVKDDKGRVMLQQVGTEIARKACGENIWCELLERVIKIINEANGGTSNFVLPSIRFICEAEWINSMGGHVVRVEREDKNRAVTGDLDHRSEVELDSREFKSLVWKGIKNDGTKGDLARKARDIYDEIVNEIYLEEPLTEINECGITIN